MKNIFIILSKNFDVRAFIRDSSANKKRIGKIFNERSEPDALHDTENFNIINQINHPKNYIIKKMLRRVQIF